MNIKWDKRFLALAKHIAQWSKDPSTQTGSVIVRPDKTIASIGYNGFPRKIPDNSEYLNNREEKYKRIIHAELNAILNAREPLVGYTIYVWPWMPCSNCALHVIQTGIIRIVSTHLEKLTPLQLERWKESFHATRTLCNEAFVDLQLLAEEGED
jgi:dCMP deaminase